MLLEIAGDVSVGDEGISDIVKWWKGSNAGEDGEEEVGESGGEDEGEGVGVKILSITPPDDNPTTTYIHTMLSPPLYLCIVDIHTYISYADITYLIRDCRHKGTDFVEICCTLCSLCPVVPPQCHLLLLLSEVPIYYYCVIFDPWMPTYLSHPRYRYISMYSVFFYYRSLHYCN